MTASSIVRILSLATAAAVVLALASAFGTGRLSLVPRLAYWLLIMVAASMFAVGVLIAVRATTRLRQLSWPEGLAVSLAAAVPTTLLILGADAIFLQERPSLGSAALKFIPVLVVTGAMIALNFRSAALERARQELAARANSESQPARKAERPRIFARLPQHMRHGAIHALQAEDHYLRVHCDCGSTLILMRLSDAIEEVQPLEGLQTHRSWWVARSAVRSAARSGERATLTLDGGLQVPVSRTFVKALQEQGWFD
jgi:hypothetical protein